MNTGRFLLLLAFVAVRSEVKTEIPPWDIEKVDMQGTARGEAFEEMEWSWVTSTMPTGDFCVSSWLNVASPTSDNPDMISIRDEMMIWGGLYFDNGRVAFWYGENDEIDESVSSFGSWFHVVVGCHAGKVFMDLTLRNGAQYLDTGISSWQLTTSSVINGPLSMGSYVLKVKYTDTVIRINENIDEIAALEFAEDTFFCGKSSGGCLECHPSCGTCAQDGTCESCSDNTATMEASNYFCLCPAGTGGVNYNGSCGSCDGSCETCFLAGKDSCKTCAGGTTPTMLLVGACDCTSPGVVKAVANPNSVPVACTHCATGCDACFGSDPSKCLSATQLSFKNYVSTAFDLPIPYQSTDNLRCFLQPRLEWDTSGCAQDPIAAVIGLAVTNGSGDDAIFKKSQCNKLLVAGWPATNYWFDHLFSSFAPTGASDSEKSDIKSIILLWVLQFGPAEMLGTEWSDLKTALSAVGANWTKFLAWVGSTPGYLTDGTSTSKKLFPPVLLDWLKSARGCNGATAGCADLQVFNMKSTVCSDSSCTVKSLCQEVDSDSNCVTSGTGTDT